MRLTPVLVLALAAFRPAAAQTSQPADEPVIPINVGLLTLERVYNSELMAPMDIFQHTVFHDERGMRVFTVGREHGLIMTFEGLRVEVEYTLDNAPPIDVLVVPSTLLSMTEDLEDETLIAWIAERGRKAKYVVSVCDGAFPLAQAGLLDGRRCTTFPGDIPAFRKRFPELNVVEGVSFVADGPIVTGVGGARSYDPALYVVQQLFGADAAAGVSAGMVLDWDLPRVRHLALDTRATPACWLPGDTIDAAVAVENAAGEPVTLREVIAAHPGTKAVVLCILAGAEATPVAQRGGFWCEDTFSEIATLRHLRLDYADKGVLFVGVLCPPIHHELRFGYTEDAFCSLPDDDSVYRRNRATFVEACKALGVSDQLPFDAVLYDPRFRLLGGGATPPGSTAPAWQGRFKWFEDTQTYGTPTTWVFAPDGTVASPPFFMNVYESDGRKLRYTPRDVEKVLEAAVRP